MRARVLLPFALAGQVLLPHSGLAQFPNWLAGTGAEVLTGLTIGSHSRSGAALDVVPRVSVDVVVKREVARDLSVFGGYFRTAFGCEEGFCAGTDLTVVGNHGALGTEWAPTLSWVPGQPWLRAGLLFGATEVGMAGDDPEFGPGILVGVGATGSIGRLVLMHGVSYRWLTANTASSRAHAVALSLHLGFGMKLNGW